MMRIYEVRTERNDTRPYDRFNVAAESFADAVQNANSKLRKDEKIQAIHLLASEGR